MTSALPVRPSDLKLDELRQVVRRLLAAKSDESTVRRQMESPHPWDHTLWLQMARELGLQGMAISEEYGGSGFGSPALAVVMEETGRSLLCAPFFETVVLAVSAIRSSADAAVAAKLLPGIADGSLTGSMALSGARVADGTLPVSAVSTPSGTRLTGAERCVSYGADTDFLLVLASSGDSSSLYLVRGDAPGLVREPLRSMDQTRRMARVRFDEVPASLVGTEGDGRNIATEALRYASTMLAAEQLGGARRILELTVEYAKVRVQFGRQIGSYQAVKHKLADLLIALTLAGSLTAEATRFADDNPGEFRVAASAASLLTGPTYVRIATEAVQLHGGIGFTWEHPAHLYLKRAKSSQLLLQDRQFHRSALASDLLNA